MQVHTDDISNVLILNKRAVSSQENQLFKSELEKFRPHQNRILQAVHKQSSLMKELTRVYSDLLQDKRVRSEQNKYEAFSRQRNSVLGKYKKVYQAYTDLQEGLSRAQHFYEEMKETVESLKRNVDSFVENRRAEGAQLLGAIEAAKGSGAEREQARLKELMERMSVSPSSHASNNTPTSGFGDPRRSNHRPPPLQPQTSYSSQPQQPMYNPAASPPITPGHPANGVRTSTQFASYQSPQSPPSNSHFRRESYNPSTYGAISPPAHQQYFSPPPNQQYTNQQQPSTTQYSQQAHNQQPQPYQQQQQYGGPNIPPGWQPPPPPPGPPPSQDYSAMQASQYPSGPGGYAVDPRRNNHHPQQQQQQQTNVANDPWSGLNAWR